LSIKIGWYSRIRGSSSPLGYYETEYLGRCPGTYLYNISWFGKEASQSVKGYVTISAGEYKEILQNLTFCDDLPQINIVKPKNAVYINNKRIIPFFSSIVIGNIEIEVNASDCSSGIAYVEFFIDNTFMFKDSTAPYTMQWNNRTFGKHSIKVVAYDTVGYCESHEITVWRVF
jgi:hypothetical protein